MAQDKQNKREFSAGMILADGLAELVESLLEDLGPTGLALTGIKPLADAIRKLGGENKFMTHGLDVMVRTAIRALGLPAPLREFLTEFADAYFDKVKTLASNPREQDVYQARETGKQRAMDRLRSFLKKATAKPSFSAMALQLDEQEFEELFEVVAYLHASDPKEYEAWNSLKELIASVEELRLVVKSAQDRETVTEKKTENVAAEANATKAVYDKAVVAANATKAVYDKAVVAANATRAVYGTALAEANAIKSVYDKALAEADTIKVVHDKAGIAADVKKAVYDKALAEADAIKVVHDKAVAAADATKVVHDKAVAAADATKVVHDKAVAAAKAKKSAHDRAMAELAQKKIACNAKRMMETLRFLHGRNPNLIDDLKAFAKGEETPQIKKLAETLKEATAAMNKKADIWHAWAKEIRARRRAGKK